MSAALLAAIGSALGWAVLDALRKRLVARIDPLPLLVALALGQVPAFAIWSLVEGRGLDDPAYVAPAAASVAVNVAANVLYLRAIAISPLSVTVPLLAFVPVFAALLAVPLLAELPTPVQLAGIASVAAGALLLNAGASTGVGLVRAFAREPGSRMMVAVALMWAVTIALDKRATQHAPWAIHGIVLNLGVGVAAAGWLVARRRTAELRRVAHAPLLLLVAIVVATVALALQLVALQDLFVGVLEASKRAGGVLFAIVIGAAAFGERIDAGKIAAALLLAAGAAAVMLG